MDNYIKEKLKVLKQLHIKLSEAQLEYLWSLETEFAIDAFCHDVIMGRPRIK